MMRLAQRLIFLALIVATGQIALLLQWSASPPAGPDIASLRIFLSSVRVHTPQANRYAPGKEELMAQQYQQARPDIGFSWKPQLDSSKQALLSWGDQEPALIVTDSFGFINSSDAIAEMRSGKQPDIIGLGASFMQGANSLFYDFFSVNNLFYYNMATHRHTLPMFNEVLLRYALPLHPKWVIYELNEASPLLLSDYQAWKKSGLDWFTFHSGTWAGPPISSQYNLGILQRFSTIDNLSVALLKKFWKKKPISPGTAQQQRDACFAAIMQADSMARSSGITMLVLYIPSKETISFGASRMSSMMDELLSLLQGAGIMTLDLRDSFRGVDDPRSLYYIQDGHWNRDGILVAVRAVQSALKAAHHDSL